jgi:hypothetical protein
MLISQEQLSTPYYSIFNIGAPYSGKTQSLVTLYKYMIARKQPARKIFLYDLDDNNSQPLVREMDKLRALDDLRVFRYGKRGGQSKVEKEDTARRSGARFEAFLDEFNQLFDMIDPRTGTWRDIEQAPGAIAIDSGTALEEDITDFVCNKRNADMNSSNVTERMSYSIWGAIKDKEVEVIKNAKGLPCHFVYNVHEELRQEVVPGQPAVPGQPQTAIAPRGTGMVYLQPALVGSLRDTMAKEFGVVVYSRAKGNRYEWIVRPGQEGAGIIRSAGTRARSDLPTTPIEQDYQKVLS